MIRNSILFIFLFVFVSALKAQPAEDLKKYQEKYPGIWAITLEEAVIINFEIVDDALFIYEDKYEKTFYLQDIAGYWKEEEIPYSSFSEIKDLKASTYLPGAKKYKVVKVKEFKEKDELSSSIFHDDIRYKIFSYEGLQKGAISEISYRTIHKEEHLLGKEFLQSYIPIEHKTYQIIADDAIEIGIAEFNLDKIKVDYTITKNKGKTIYTWEINNVNDLDNESSSPGISWYAPHVIPYVKSYTIDGNTTNVLRNTSDLFNWYNGIIGDLNGDKKDPELQLLVDSIIAGALDELDIVRKVFYWTQDNIKYIAIEYGMGGFVPREANFVCQNRYGDCKDMASTITQLLSYAGVKSYITWIGTNSLPYRYSDVPTPVVDNHMIATYIDKDGKYYFLDATGRYYKFGLPSAFIQGKEALIKLGANEFEVIEVPVLDAIDNKIAEKVFLTINGKNLNGHAVSSIEGYQKAQFEYQIENISDDDKLKFYKSFFTKGSNKFLPNNFKEENLYPNEIPLEVSYDFSINDYILTNGDEMYINMNLDNNMEGQKIEDERTIPIRNKYGIAFESENTLEVPSGWSVDYMPENLNVENEFIRYHSKYEIKDQQITLYQKTHINYLTIQKDSFKIWNDSILKIKKSQNEVVIIKQNNE